MKPVAIFRHTNTERSGYFATFLRAHSIRARNFAVERGSLIPPRADEFSGLCFMGGPMSVNDPELWVEAECALIRDAVEKGIPVIGHCLGGQLMSKALGGVVTRNPVKEIGWSRLRCEHNAVAAHWLGDLLGADENQATVFQWHGETFSIPHGGTRILANDFCANQMFALGPHLGMQCHIEMTPQMIARWSKDWSEEVAHLTDYAALPECVQRPERILAEIPQRLPLMRRLADQLYGVWIKGLRR